MQVQVATLSLQTVSKSISTAPHSEMCSQSYCYKYVLDDGDIIDDMGHAMGQSILEGDPDADEDDTEAGMAVAASQSTESTSAIVTSEIADYVIANLSFLPGNAEDGDDEEDVSMREVSLFVVNRRYT